MRRVKTICVLLLAVTLMITGCGNNSSQSEGQSSGELDENKFPTKPISLLVPYAPGGSSDMAARILSKYSQKYLGAPLVVVNKPGGGGSLAYDEVVEANPDGYTLALVTTTSAINPIYGGTKYKYPVDMQGIAKISDIPHTLTVNANAEYKTLEDFIQYVKNHPDNAKYGTSTIGGATHITAETFCKAAGIKMEVVPFDGGSSVMTALLGNHIQASFDTIADAREQVQAGKLRVLAIASEKRVDDPLWKDTPTFKEKGLDVVGGSWNGIAAPKGIPDYVKSTFADGFGKMLNDPDVIDEFKKLGLTVNYLGPDEFEEFWNERYERFTEIVTETGILEQMKSQKK